MFGLKKREHFDKDLAERIIEENKKFEEYLNGLGRDLPKGGFYGMERRY